MEDPESSLRTDGPPSPVNYEKSLMDRWTLYEAFCPSLQVVPPVRAGRSDWKHTLDPSLPLLTHPLIN